MTEEKNIVFSIAGKDATNLAKFKRIHKRCISGTTGDKYSYTFVPTAIGMATTVKCSCGQEILLGNFMDHDQREVDISKLGPLTEEDVANKAFEEDAYSILCLEDPRLCRIFTAREQSFDMIYFFAVGKAQHADKRISKSILYSYTLDERHHQTDNYLGTDQENIDLFFEYFRDRVREEIAKYDCKNERLLNILFPAK